MTKSKSEFYSRLMLAPIAGVTDRATRTIARELGCPLTFSELISATGLAVGNRGTLTMLESCRDEPQLVIQLFGKDPHLLEEATKKADDLGPDGIDLNLGCPAKKVVNHGSGIALTRDLGKLAEITAAMRRSTSRPFSVKIRAGWNHEELNFLEVAHIAQEEGVDGIIFHARTRAMGFTGEAYWPWIGELKRSTHLPVVGNGDVADGPSAARMLSETGCDGVMVGRGAYGNPWVFHEIKHYLETRVIPPRPNLRTRIGILIRHLRAVVEDKGERKGVLEMRKQVGWYLKGFPLVKELRQVVNRLESLDEVIRTLRAWSENMPEDLVAMCRTGEPVSAERCGLCVGDKKGTGEVSDLQKVFDHFLADLTQN